MPGFDVTGEALNAIWIRLGMNRLSDSARRKVIHLFYEEVAHWFIDHNLDPWDSFYRRNPGYAKEYAEVMKFMFMEEAQSPPAKAGVEYEGVLLR